MEEWDDDINMSDTERRNREYRRIIEERSQQRENSRRSRGYFNVDPIPENVIRENFEHHRDREVDDSPAGRSWRPWDWTAGREVWVCHNCGMFGYKYSLHELFKCYCCRSRNVTVCRAGEISMFLRSNTGIGVNMGDVYSRRRERLRQARIARRNQ